MPLSELIDIEQEKQRINKEITELENFIQISNKKLNNENFVNKAAEIVVQREKDLLASNQEKLENLKKNLQNLD